MSSTTFNKSCPYIVVDFPSRLTNVTCSLKPSFHNATEASFSLSFSNELKICLYILYSLIFLLGTLGNGLVCFVIGIKKKTESSGDTFIVSLAVSDLLASIFTPVLMITDVASDFKVWYFGDIGCHILPSISPVTLVASSWSLVVISLDRYRAINLPLSVELPTNVKILGLLIIWLISIGFCMPYTLALTVDGNFCWAIGFSSPKMAAVWCGCFLTIGWIIPMIIMTCLYSLIARKLKFGEQSHANNPNSILQIRKENRTILKMFITIVFIFFLLTMPYSMFYFTLAYLESDTANEINYDIMVSVNYGLFVLTMLNSCTNPLIYAKMHSKIRETITEYSCCGKGIMTQGYPMIHIRRGLVTLYELSGVQREPSLDMV